MWYRDPLVVTGVWITTPPGGNRGSTNVPLVRVATTDELLLPGLVCVRAVVRTTSDVSSGSEDVVLEGRETVGAGDASDDDPRRLCY